MEQPALKFSLYVIGAKPETSQLIEDLNEVLSRLTHAGQLDLTVIDIVKTPELAIAADIIATPTLICKQAAGHKALIGDVANEDKLLALINNTNGM